MLVSHCLVGIKGVVHEEADTGGTWWRERVMGQGRVSCVLNSWSNSDLSLCKVGMASGMEWPVCRADGLMSWKPLLDTLEEQPQTSLSPTCLLISLRICLSGPLCRIKLGLWFAGFKWPGCPWLLPPLPGVGSVCVDKALGDE